VNRTAQAANAFGLGLRACALCATLAIWAVCGLQARAQPAKVASPDPGNPRRSIAIFGMTGLPMDKHLRAHGWEVAALRWGQNQTVDDLKRFHVIVLATHPAISRDTQRNDQFYVTPSYHAAFVEALKGYVSLGGGLLVYQALWPTNSVQHVNASLEPFSARLLDEQIQDAKHAYTQDSGMLWTWLYTTDIAGHATTSGVRGLFYPVRDVHMPAHSPLALDREWKTLVKGMASATSHPTRKDQHNLVINAEVAGSYSSAPPLAALRDFGKGTVAAFGWCPTQTFFNYQHFMVQDVYFEGTTTSPSDGLRFLEQTLSYLAAPAVKAGLGGYVETVPSPDLLSEKPLNWRSERFDETPARWRKGIVGARSSLTGGSGNPADYAREAQKAGLDFVAFLEDMTQLTPNTWDAFRQECRDASNQEVLVLPGLVELRGSAETAYFFVGDGPLPPADMRSPDGRTVINHLYAHFAMGAWTHGPFNLKRQKTPPWISRAYTAQAVVTTIAGDTSLDSGPYLYNVGIQDGPRPVAVDLIDTPSDVGAAAGRFLTLRKAEDLEALRTAFQHADQSGPGQISNGPLIATFDSINATRDSQGEPAPGRERFQLRLVAESPSPLKEAIIYNGTEIYRRLSLKGERCDLRVNGVHDRQYMFTAAVTDETGRFAICGPLEIYDNFNRRTMCSDRRNTIGLSFDRDIEGKRVEIDACFDQPKFQTNGDLPGVPGSASIMGWVPWYWDGTPGPMFHGHLVNSLAATQSKSSMPPTALHRMMFPLGSQDVIIQAAATEAQTEKPDHSREFAPVSPLPYRADVRFYEFKKQPDAPASMLIEGQYEMLEDVPMTTAPWLYETRISQAFYAFSGRPSAAARWSVITPANAGEADQVFPPKSQEHNAFHTVDAGGYVAFSGPQSTLAVFPLDQAMGCWLWLNDQQWLRGWVGLPRRDGIIGKGTRIPYRVVVFTGRPSADSTRAEIESFRRDFGLAGPPTYRVEPIQGRILSTCYVLEAEVEDMAFHGRFEPANLVHRLPIRVHGVNRDWTCVIVDLKTGGWRPVGMAPNLAGVTPLSHAAAAYVALDLTDAKDVWIGHPVVSNTASVRLTVFTDGNGRFSVEAHNATTETLDTTFRSSPGCPLFTLPSTSVRLAPRSTVLIDVP
jgi:hypothetical protein